jgi:hypothetical protein
MIARRLRQHAGRLEPSLTKACSGCLQGNACFKRETVSDEADSDCHATARLEFAATDIALPAVAVGQPSAGGRIPSQYTHGVYARAGCPSRCSVGRPGAAATCSHRTRGCAGSLRRSQRHVPSSHCTWCRVPGRPLSCRVWRRGDAVGVTMRKCPRPSTSGGNLACRVNNQRFVQPYLDNRECYWTNPKYDCSRAPCVMHACARSSMCIRTVALLVR